MTCGLFSTLNLRLNEAVIREKLFVACYLNIPRLPTLSSSYATNDPEASKQETGRKANTGVAPR
jgi:hypothetical protein